MKVLGISPLDKESTVTLVEDGVVTYAAAEERFTRTKQQDGFPWRALGDAMSATGTSASDIDRVVYPFLPWEEETRLFERNLAGVFRSALDGRMIECNEAFTRLRGRAGQRRGPRDQQPADGRRRGARSSARRGQCRGTGKRRTQTDRERFGLQLSRGSLARHYQ